MHLPVLLVHGIWDTGEKLAPLARALEAAGIPRTHCLALSKNDGSALLMDLAREVATAAQALGPKIDLVGFSMGALVSRSYVQRLGGRERVRRFVSISGPHQGTLWARFGRAQGVRDMAPGNAFLRDLERDADPWGAVEVHTVWTPFDAMIVPARSSVLPGAASDTQLPILVHRWVPNDPRTIAHVVRVLTA